jgi:ThiF family
VSVQGTLSRTISLVRQLLATDELSNSDILAALTQMRVCISADEANLSSQASQSCLVTLTQLLIDMGCRVRLAIPNVAVIGPQPPLRLGRIADGLVDLSMRLIPEQPIVVCRSASRGEFELAIGDSVASNTAGRRLVAGDWWGGIRDISNRGQPLIGTSPVGAGVAAAIAAAEPFKALLRSLVTDRKIKLGTPDLLDCTSDASISLACSGQSELGQRHVTDLGSVDFISGGAITMAAAHLLLRVPGLKANLRIIEPDFVEESNLNRYLLATREDLGRPKIDVFSKWADGRSVTVVGLARRFEKATLAGITPLADKVVVGCDDIPTRWLAQQQWPEWLGVGATASCHTLVSEHDPSSPCAQCLHHTDDEFRGEIPTVSFVSYWAGLLVASRLLRAGIGEPLELRRQASNLVPLRLDLPAAAIFGQVRRWENCPTCRSRHAP